MDGHGGYKTLGLRRYSCVSANFSSNLSCLFLLLLSLFKADLGTILSSEAAGGLLLLEARHDFQNRVFFSNSADDLGICVAYLSLNLESLEVEFDVSSFSVIILCNSGSKVVAIDGDIEIDLLFGDGDRFKSKLSSFKLLKVLFPFSSFKPGSFSA